MTIPDDLKRKFQVSDALGAGGMGLVYRAVQASLKREVALKILDPTYLDDSEIRDRFMVEARLASRINHPNVVRVLDFGEAQDKTLWIAYELIEGENLRQLLNRTKLSADQVVMLARTMLTGIAAIHKDGILHRDLKPENFLVQAPGIVKVTDFGVARDVQDAIARTKIGTVVGTPAYISPEQADGQKATIQSDVYSAAICIYEMLTGRPPFTGDTINDILDGHLFKDPPPMRMRKGGLPAGLDKVIFKALDKEPEFRYARCEEFMRALQPFEGRPPPIPFPNQKPVSRQRPALRGVGAAGESGKVAGGKAMRQSRKAAPVTSPEGSTVSPVLKGIIGGSLVLGLAILGGKIWGRLSGTKPLVVASTSPTPSLPSTPTPKPTPAFDQAAHDKKFEAARASIAEGHKALVGGKADGARASYLESFKKAKELGYEKGGRDILQWAMEGAIHLGPPWKEDPVGPFLTGVDAKFKKDSLFWLLTGLYSHAFTPPGQELLRAVTIALASLGELDPPPEAVHRARLQRLLATALPIGAQEKPVPGSQTPRSREILALALLRRVHEFSRSSKDDGALEQAALARIELAAHLARRGDGYLADEILQKVQEMAKKFPEDNRRRVTQAHQQVKPIVEQLQRSMASDLPLSTPAVEAEPDVEPVLAKLGQKLASLENRLVGGKDTKVLPELAEMWAGMATVMEPVIGPVPFGRLAHRDSLSDILVRMVRLAASHLGRPGDGLAATALLGKIEAAVAALRGESDNLSSFWAVRGELALPGGRFADAEESMLVSLEQNSRLTQPDPSEEAMIWSLLARLYEQWALKEAAGPTAQQDPQRVRHLANLGVLASAAALETLPLPGTGAPPLRLTRLDTRRLRCRLFDKLNLPDDARRERRQLETEFEKIRPDLPRESRLRFEKEIAELTKQR